MSDVSVTLPGSAGGARVVIAVWHNADVGMAAAFERWQQLSAAAQLSAVICVECFPGAPTAHCDAVGAAGDMASDAERLPQALRRTRILHDGTWSEARLLFTLHGAGDLERVDIVSSCTAALGDGGQSELAEADRLIRLDIQRISAPQTDVLLHRVWLPDYGDEGLAPSASYVNAAADHAFVVLPTDRQHDRACAMPVSCGDPGGTAGWHAAAEIASLAGLWSTMNGAPLETTTAAHGGLGEPLVRLTRSMARAVRVRTPSPEQSLEGAGMLPLSPGFLPAPDPDRIVADAASQLVPGQFRRLHDLGMPRRTFPSGWRRSRGRSGDDNTPDDRDTDMTAPTAAERAHHALMPLAEPVASRRRALTDDRAEWGHESEHSAAANAIDAFVARTAAAAPWVMELLDESGRDTVSTDWAMHSARRRLEHERPPVSLDSVPTAGWDDMVADAFGLVDAAQQSEQLRAKVVGGRYLITEPEAIAPACEGDLASALRQINGHGADARADEAAVPAADNAVGPPAAPDPQRRAVSADRLDTETTATDSSEHEADVADEASQPARRRRTRRRRSPSGKAAGSVGGGRDGGASAAGVNERAYLRFWFPHLPWGRLWRGRHRVRTAAPTLRERVEAVADLSAQRRAASVSDGADGPGPGDRQSALGEDGLDDGTDGVGIASNDGRLEEMGLGHAVSDRAGAPAGAPRRRTLLSAVTREFDGEIDRAERRLDGELEVLRHRLSFAERPTPGLTLFVAMVIFASLLAMAGALLTLTPLRGFVTPDRLESGQRIGLFGLGTLAAVLPAALRLTPRRSPSAQVYLTLLAAALAALATALATLSDEIALTPLDRPGQWTPAVAAFLAVVVLSAVSLAREFRGDRELLGPFACLATKLSVSVALTFYVFGVIVAALNRGVLDPQGAVTGYAGMDLVVLVFATACAAALVAEGLRRIIRRRDRQLVRDWQEGIDESINRSELACARVEMFRQLKSHWLATAAVIGRVTHRPFGREVQTDYQADPVPTVRKLLMFELELSRESRDAFLNEVIPELAPPGWLREQYRWMAERFMESERRRLGISDPEGFPPPEHCTYPMVSDDLDGEVKHGVRWRFAERVWRGEYDRMLRERTDEALRRAMQTTFLNESVSVASDAVGTDGRSLPTLLGELLPTGPSSLPATILPPSTAAPPRYEPHVWWPADVAAPDSPPGMLGECRYRADGGTVLFHAVRVDISEPVGLDRLRPLEVRDVQPLPYSSAQSARGEPLM